MPSRKLCNGRKEAGRDTFLFFSACFWLEKWVQTSYARESRVDPFIRFLCHPLRALSGVCRLEQDVSVNDFQQEMR